jgi:CheY-like chemotaxis protein
MAGNILLVDDDADIRDAMRDVLSDAGYNVWEAENGKAALDLLRDVPLPCLVVLDMMMPVMDGPTFLNQLRADGPDLRKLPVVAISAAPQRPLPQVHEWLSKPFEVGSLLRLVERHCPN